MSATDFRYPPKRVILRLRVDEIEDRGYAGYLEAIRTYLLFAGRPTSEVQENRHYAHIEPFQSPEIHQVSFHIILDMDKDLVVNPNLTELPHEIYRLRRDQNGDLQIKRYQPPLVEQNMIARVREYTDALYDWGK